MAPWALSGSAPWNQAMIRAGSRPEVSIAFSVAVWRRVSRGQPARSRLAWSSWKKDSCSPSASMAAHKAILRATGSLICAATAAAPWPRRASEMAIDSASRSASDRLPVVAT